MNANALRHPRVSWEIEAALWRATEYGAAIACTAAGKEIVSIVHDRSQVPAFSFWRGCEDVSAEFLKVLRAQG
jgi:hypothetical protein